MTSPVFPSGRLRMRSSSSTVADAHWERRSLDVMGPRSVRKASSAEAELDPPQFVALVLRSRASQEEVPMRKVSFALAIGLLLCACGGEDTKPPQTPATPAAATPPATTATAEAPKEEAKPKESLAQLMEKTGRGLTE